MFIRSFPTIQSSALAYHHRSWTLRATHPWECDGAVLKSAGLTAGSQVEWQQNIWRVGRCHTPEEAGKDCDIGRLWKGYSVLLGSPEATRTRPLRSSTPCFAFQANWPQMMVIMTSSTMHLAYFPFYPFTRELMVRFIYLGSRMSEEIA